MKCEICEKWCEKTVMVFIKGSDERQLCNACVVRLRTQKLEYRENRQRYQFVGHRRKNGFLRGRANAAFTTF